VVLWVLSIFIKDISVVDYAWGLGFAIQSYIYFKNSIHFTFFKIFSEKFSWEKVTFAILVAVHGIRLAAYLFMRNRGKPEDKRYRVLLREKMPNHFWWMSYFVVVIPQMLANLFIGLTIYEFDNASKSNINHLWYWMGILTMVSGTLIQSLADMQMYFFKNAKRNEGKVLDSGLWRLSRHPNYFGDALFWWGTFLCNFSIGKVYTIVCPLLFTFLVVYVTGIPQLEKFLIKEKGDRYLDYMKTTPAFLPFFKLGSKGKEKINAEQYDQNIHTSQPQNFNQQQQPVNRTR
jgi:steroid 5-alpha reductase family enzyme